MADSQVEEIKSKLNVVDVVGSYVKLTKTGINYRGVCPFHAEKTPSFFVSSTRQMWHCFGCGAGSSIFDFIMKIEGVEFLDALRLLAKKAGIELKQENKEVRTERQRLYEICDLACKFFEKQREASGAGKEAEAYLLKRGITKDSLNLWRVGYSPDTWNSLTDFLVGKGYHRQEVVKAGLAIEKEGRTGESYDRFRGRIMFPVFDVNGQVVGFGGRVFKQQETAKYINTPQTLLYDKSGVLYGLHRAKVPIRKKSQCVVTEGYTDVIMCHQAGYDNTVAASGTALTGRHLMMLKRYTENLVLAFDMDVAGDSATKRGISGAQQQGFSIKIIESYEKNLDPADIIAKDPAQWEAALARAKSIMDYYVDSAFANNDAATPEGKKAIAGILLPAIKILPSKIEQSHWIQKLSEKLGIKEEVILQEMAQVNVVVEKPEEIAVPMAAPENTERSRVQLLEEKILSLILRNPGDVLLIGEAHWPLFSDNVRQFLQKVAGLVTAKTPLNEEEIKKDFAGLSEGGFFDFVPDGEFKNFLAALVLRADTEYQGDGKDEVTLCLFQLKQVELKNKLQAISQGIKEAEIAKDSQKAHHLMEEFNTLSREL